MKSIAVLALLAAFSVSQASTLFYGGDPTGVNGLVSGSNLVSSGQAFTYDDFNLSANSNITGMFGDWYVAAASESLASFTTGTYDIRTGITDDGTNVTNTGTSVASGTMSIVATDTGLTNFGLEIYRMTATGLNVSLGAGHYWMMMAPVGDGVHSIYVTTANGTVGEGTQAGIGSPLGNGNSYFDAVSVYGTGWSLTSSQLGAGAWDFSYGLTGSAAPEPASIALVGFGALALIRRRYSKKS